MRAGRGHNGEFLRAMGLARSLSHWAQPTQRASSGCLSKRTTLAAGNDFPQQWQGAHSLASPSRVSVMGLPFRRPGWEGDSLGWQVRFALCNGPDCLSSAGSYLAIPVHGQPHQPEFFRCWRDASIPACSASRSAWPRCDSRADCRAAALDTTSRGRGLAADVVHHPSGTAQDGGSLGAAQAARQRDGGCHDIAVAGAERGHWPV